MGLDDEGPDMSRREIEGLLVPVEANGETLRGVAFEARALRYSSTSAGEGKGRVRRWRRVWALFESMIALSSWFVIDLRLVKRR